MTTCCECRLLFALFDFLFWTRITTRQSWLLNPGLQDWQLTLLGLGGGGEAGCWGGRSPSVTSSQSSVSMFLHLEVYFNYFKLFFWVKWSKSKVRCDRFDVFNFWADILCASVSSANPCTSIVLHMHFLEVCVSLHIYVCMYVSMICTVHMSRIMSHILFLYAHMYVGRSIDTFLLHDPFRTG